MSRIEKIGTHSGHGVTIETTLPAGCSVDSGGVMDSFDKPHRRYNPLKYEWVLVSPQRNKRPWLGQVEPNGTIAEPGYDSGCYLCPTNQRANGEHNPEYQRTFVFDNDFPALAPTTDAMVPNDD
jgi:UDPglucose--hexose-1-phosphate uridylyltransferase